MLTLITEMQLPQSPHEVAASAPEHKHGPHSSHPPRGLTAVFSHHSLQHSLITLCSIVSSLSAVFSHHSLQYSLKTHCSFLWRSAVLSLCIYLSSLCLYVTAVHWTPEVIMPLSRSLWWWWVLSLSIVLWCCLSPRVSPSEEADLTALYLMLLDHCKWRQLGGHWAAQLSSPVATVSWGQWGPIRAQCCVSIGQSEPGIVSTPPPVWPLLYWPGHRLSNSSCWSLFHH